MGCTETFYLDVFTLLKFIWVIVSNGIPNRCLLEVKWWLLVLSPCCILCSYLNYLLSQSFVFNQKYTSRSVQVVDNLRSVVRFVNKESKKDDSIVTVGVVLLYTKTVFTSVWVRCYCFIPGHQLKGVIILTSHWHFILDGSNINWIECP